MFSVYFIMQMSNGCRLTWFKWVNSIFLFTLIIQTATKKKKRKKPCKRSKGISLFPSQPFPAAQQQSCRADGAGWVLASWWGGCQALAGAARQPRAKNDPRLTQLSGSRVLTNGADQDQQNSLLARGQAAALHSRAACLLTRCWQPGVPCLKAIVRTPAEGNVDRQDHLLPIDLHQHYRMARWAAGLGRRQGQVGWASPRKPKSSPSQAEGLRYWSLVLPWQVLQQIRANSGTAIWKSWHRALSSLEEAASLNQNGNGIPTDVELL